MATQNQAQRYDSGPETAIPPSRFMSEEEFVAWCDEDTRAEWVDGEAIMMSPANKEHVLLVRWLLSFLGVFAEQQELGTVVSDFQVRFPGRRSRRVPDILFITKDREPLMGATTLDGAPDLIVEIVSPDSQARDWRDKYLEYQAAGVREYWVIDPASQHMEAYALAVQAGQVPAYRRLDEKDGLIESTVLAGLKLRTAWLWPATRPKVLEALREVGLPTA